MSFQRIVILVGHDWPDVCGFMNLILNRMDQWRPQTSRGAEEKSHFEGNGGPPQQKSGSRAT